jgi:hypothetical protein
MGNGEEKAKLESVQVKFRSGLYKKIESSIILPTFITLGSKEKLKNILCGPLL